jgi:hypothetical protein
MVGDGRILKIPFSLKLPWPIYAYFTELIYQILQTEAKVLLTSRDAAIQLGA